MKLNDIKEGLGSLLSVEKPWEIVSTEVQRKNEVQMAKSRARGFRNMDNFKAMIYCLGNDFNFKFHTK